MELFDRPSMEVVCYTAGLFDGEGSIWIQAQGNRYLCSISQGEVNDGESLCLWLQSSWGFGRVNCQRKHWSKRGEEHNQWHWNVNRARRVRFLLSTLLPYLHVKREAALRALAVVPPDARYRWEPSEDRFIEANWGILSEGHISSLLSRTITAIRHRARLLGLPDKRRNGLRIH
jgi:hypothetical protein